MPAERSPKRADTASRDKNGDPKRLHRLRDALPLGKSAAHDARHVAIDASHKTDKKSNEWDDQIKHSNPTVAPRSESFFQHDDRGTATRDGRRSGPGRTSERGLWNDSREDRTTHRITDSAAKERVEQPGARRGIDHGWQHDKFSEADANQPAKRRRHFREEKLPLESEPTADAAPKPMKDAESLLESARHEERHRERRPLERGEYHHQSYVRERSFSNRGHIEKTGLPPRDRFNGNNLDQKYRGRDNFGRPQGYRSDGGRVDKWKHDMFIEEDPPKNEEDPVAKVEALLSL